VQQKLNILEDADVMADFDSIRVTQTLVMPLMITDDDKYTEINIMHRDERTWQKYDKTQQHK